jgi:putative DNA primase/helicase
MRPRLDIMAEARGRWPGILPQCGIPAKALSGKHCPCPCCGGKDRFRFDNKGGDGTYICNQCGAGNGIGLVMKKNGWSFREAADRVRALAGITPKISAAKVERSTSDALVASIWQEAVPIEGTATEAYLRARGLRDFHSPEIRHHPRCLLVDVPGHSSAEAMIALIRDHGNRPCAISRLYLDGAEKARWRGSDGKIMASRKFLGQFPKGAAVRLWPLTSGRLGVAEGVETALACREIFGTPTWAVLNTSLMEEFQLPAGTDALMIYGDNDPQFGGQKASYTLAHRAALHKAPPLVGVDIPEGVKTDWLDVLKTQRARA